MAELAFNLDLYRVDAVSHPASHENRIGDPQGSFTALAQPREKSKGKGSASFGLLPSVSQAYSTLKIPLSVCEPVFLSFPRRCIWREVNDLNPAMVISFPHLS